MTKQWLGIMLLGSLLIGCGGAPAQAPSTSADMTVPDEIVSSTPAVDTSSSLKPAEVAVAAPIAGNILKNATFEEGMTEWWTWITREGEARIEIANGQGRDGKNCVLNRFVSPKDEIYSFVVQSLFNPPGKTVTARCWARAAAEDPLAGPAAAILVVEFWKNKEKKNFVESSPLNGSAPWTELTVTAPLPPDGADEVRVALVLKGDKEAGGTVLFDDVSLVSE